MNRKILFVDDDMNLLKGLLRVLFGKYEADIATSAAEALELIPVRGPYAVLVADMKMPGMGGIDLLATVKERWPDMVRVMLTGNADRDTAIDAVNEGHVFRFLTKPCAPARLTTALDAALEQHQLITSERELLEKTLSSSVRVLIDLLNIANPAAYGRASRLRTLVQHIATEMQLPDRWQYELAAMLSQIGCVSVPPEVLKKVESNVELFPEEQALYSAHPAVGARLLATIPRLDPIARMIEGQQRPFSTFASPAPSTHEDATATGAQLLKIAFDFDQLILLGYSWERALAVLRRRSGHYHPAMIDALVTIATAEPPERFTQHPVADLKVGMVVAEEVRTREGRVLALSGQELNLATLIAIQSYASLEGVFEPVRVLAPPPVSA